MPAMRFPIAEPSLAFVLMCASYGCQSSQPNATKVETVQHSAQSVPAALPSERSQPTPGESERIAEFVKSQVETGNVYFDSILDRQVWPLAPDPNTSIVLGLTRQTKMQTLGTGLNAGHLPFVLLVQSGSGEKSEDLKLLGMILQTSDEEHYPQSIDVTPFQIADDEYAFGVRSRAGSTGNKGGQLFEVMSLYRYHDDELQEIFRDTVWAYSKYSEKNWKSRNVDMKIVSQPAREGRFFTITREYVRSYLGNAKNPEFSNSQDLTETPGDCSLSERFGIPKSHSWNTEKDKYLDSRGAFLDWDDFYKGWPF
jgi:hypothetical protein